MQPTLSPTRGPYSLAGKGVKYPSFSFLPPSGFPDSAFHWPNPVKTQGTNKLLMFTLQMSRQRLRAGPREMESGPGGANRSCPAQSSRMDVNGGKGEEVETWCVKEHTKTQEFLVQVWGIIMSLTEERN